MFQSRISVIEGHNRHTSTDKLYEPLRKTFLIDTTAKKNYLEDVSRVSKISHTAEIHTYAENHQLGEKTLIPEEVVLRPRGQIEQVPYRDFRIINAEERTFSPISAEEFEERQKRKAKDEVIVYTYGDEEVQARPAPLRRKNSGIKVTQPKYNMFSVIDEPINNLLSGGACTCPANELIASQRSEVNWDGLYSDIK